MGAIELIRKVRERWEERVVHRLARGEEVRDRFRQELSRYFDLVEQAVLSGYPDWVNEVLDQWIAARTQSEQQQQEQTLAPILEHIFLSLAFVAREMLTPEQAINVVSAYLTLHTHALQYVTRRETDSYVQYITAELIEVKSRLEQIDKTKSKFISVAAHELKTPLTLIEGYASMLASSLSPDDGIKPLMDGIATGVQRLREIIDDMIDVSLIDNNMLELNFQPVWLNQLLGIAAQDLQEALKERNLTLEIKDFPGSDEMMFADSARLYQAFWHLLTNAVKYTPDGGKITVDGRMLPGFVEVTVSDTGIGIDPEDHEIIFEKFGNLGDVSLHSSGKTKFKGGGPGLGLPIVKGIIEAHGGTIWVESPGHDEKTCPGSTFHVLLPLRKEAPSEQINRLFGQAASSQD
ncbi:MAG: sensor histidine kinase [Anaerolineae bacterium]|nr:MAG: sensor histidine kinase [Anaerolineae bacterium]